MRSSGTEVTQGGDGCSRIRLTAYLVTPIREGSEQSAARICVAMTSGSTTARPTPSREQVHSPMVDYSLWATPGLRDDGRLVMEDLQLHPDLDTARLVDGPGRQRRGSRTTSQAQPLRTVLNVRLTVSGRRRRDRIRVGRPAGWSATGRRGIGSQRGGPWRTGRVECVRR
jgi:hypothetical protein